MTSRSILFVDDEEKILRGVERQVGDAFDVQTAVGPEIALQRIERSPPFAVIVSDMRMPGMNGVELLKHVRQKSPDTVRMILTGFADLNATIEAVNEGHIFRFLSKPCPPELLASSLREGLKQYDLVMAERELVDGTLRGSVKVLSDVLALLNPLAFGQSQRIRRTVDGIIRHWPVTQRWQLEIAAMLSCLGCVTLPESLLQKQLAGGELTFAEQNLIGRHPTTAAQLLAAIPRLEDVAAIIRWHLTPFHPDLSKQPAELRQAVQILSLSLRFDCLEARLECPLTALIELAKQDEGFDAELLDALRIHIRDERSHSHEFVQLSQLREGMILAENLCTPEGTLLMAKGYQISASARERLDNLLAQSLSDLRIKIIARPTAAPAPSSNVRVPSN